MLPGLRVSSSLRLLPEYRSSALSTDVTACADSGCRSRRQCICTVAVGYRGGIIWIQRSRATRRLCVRCARFERTGSPANTRKPQQRSLMPENQPITAYTSVHHSLLISNSLLSLYRLMFPVLSWFPTTGTYSAFNNLRKPKKNHTEQITPGTIPL